MEDSLENKFFWRVEAEYTAHFDPDTERTTVTGPYLSYHKFPLGNRTPKGQWLRIYSNKKWKWIGDSFKRKYAHPSKEEALRAYVERKKYYVSKCETRLNKAKRELEIGKNFISGVDVLGFAPNSREVSYEHNSS